MTATTERREHKDIEIDHDDGSTRDIVRIRYVRPADEQGVCPFCETDERAEWVDETGPGGTYRKQRFECDCGAHGEGVWTWEAATEPTEERDA